MVERRTILAGLAGVALIAAGGIGSVAVFGVADARAGEAPKIYVNSVTGVAINGYDPVAYFTQGEPVEGSADFSATWRDALWYFASAENRDLFVADPEHYAPQYGGWCAFAMAHDAFATTVPEAWTIRDGKLYLNFSQGVRTQWLSDADRLISLADANWAAKYE